MPDTTDRNLLYGVLALQMGFIERDALINSLQAWVSAKSKPLSQILLDQSALARKDHPAVEYAVRRHLEKSHYDATQCLTSLDVELKGTVRSLLREIEDGDLQRTLREVESEESRRVSEAPVETAASPPRAPVESADVIDLRQFFDEDEKTSRPRYRHLHSHAKGGLGEVFLAWDEEVGREVALKEIRHEYASDERMRSRFVREAEVNGNLEHPGIVPIYGLGVYPDGRPYYAMRFVQGESLQVAITRLYINGESMPQVDYESELRKLLGALIDVCHAIAYAHSRGVLHRDLKPANILLGTFGETLIIDWGLAKVLDQADGESSVGPAAPEPVHLHSSEASTVPTIAGETLGSPPYMSPEQARGEHETLDKSSDIYSLGATLYAVLTGQPPVADKQVKVILKKVIEGEIAPPLTVNPRIPEALAAICMKAMSLKPRDRYTTAHALSDDLENWLADRPVTVHRDSISTSLLRWARHHRTLVSTSAVILIAGLAGLSIITAVINDQKRQVEKAWSREQLARRVAERSLEDAQLERIRATQNLAVGLKVIDELVSLGDRQLFEGRPAAQRKKFLETASSFIRRFDDRSTSDLAMKARVARVGQQLANLERATGDYDKAETLYAESIALLDPLAEPEEAPAELRDQLAETLLDQGQTALERGHADAATQALLRARRLAQENNRRHPANLAYRRTLGRSLYLEGAALLATGDDQAATALRDAVATLASVADETLPTVRLQLSREQPLPFYDQSQAVAAMGQLGISLRQADAAAEALTVQRRAFERLQELGRILDGLALPDLELYRAWTQARLAETLLESQTDAVEPLERLNDAVNRLEKLVTAQPDIQRYHEYLADALILRARALDQEGKNEMARADVERARSLISPLLKTNPDLPDYQGLLAQAFLVEGDLARKPGGAGVAKARERYESALAAYEAALKVLPKNRDLLKGRDACRTRLAD